MKDKIKAIFDSKAFWAMAGAFIGGTFGEPFTTVFNAVGVAVMAIL